MFSTVPLVRQALVDLFRLTLDQPGDPEVFYGAPGREVPGRYVVVGSVLQQVTRTIRRLPHDLTSSIDEEYDLTVQAWTLVRSRNDQDAQRQAFEDTFATMARLDDALRADYTLRSVASAPDGSQLVTHAHLSTLDLAEGPLSEGRESVITATVAVKAARI